MEGPMAEALKRGREKFNAKFAAARTAGLSIDPGEFSRHLSDAVDPIVRAVAGEFAEKTDAVTVGLYDLSLELFGLSMLGAGARSSTLTQAWREIFPAIPRLIARDPTLVAGCVCNAIQNLAATSGARPGEWIAAMRQIGPRCASPPEFLDCGKVLAWKSGMAHYRLGALETAMRMPAALAAACMGLTSRATVEGIGAIVDRLRDNPWLEPSKAIGANASERLELVAKVGAFRGFGDAFIRPPTVFGQASGLFVEDGESCWRLLADVFGSELIRVGSAGTLRSTGMTVATVDAGGKIQWAELSTTVPALSSPTSVATDGRTLAITVATSHQVYLVGKV